MKPLFSGNQRQRISAALRCCKAHARINRKIGNSTACKTIAPENFSSKLCTRDYVGNGNYCGNSDANRFNGASPQVGEIELK